MSCDPFELNLEGSRYCYSLSNPVLFLDRNGKWPSLSELADDARNAGRALVGYGKGFFKGVVGQVRGIVQAVQNPQETVEALGRVLSDPEVLLEAVREYGREFHRAAERGDAERMGEMIGEAVGGLAPIFAAGRATTAARRAITAVRRAGTASRPRGRFLTRRRSSQSSPQANRSAIESRRRPSTRAPLTSVEIIDRLEEHVRDQNQRLAIAIRNRNIDYLRDLGLSQRQIDILLDPERRTFAPEYGKALENAVARAIRLDPELSGMIEDIRHQSGVAFPPPQRPDFVFISGPLEGIIIDLTTERQRAEKLIKFHDRILVLTYSRPNL